MKTSPCRNAQFITEEIYKAYADKRINPEHWITHTHTHKLLALIHSDANTRDTGGSFRSEQGED